MSNKNLIINRRSLSKEQNSSISGVGINIPTEPFIISVDYGISNKSMLYSLNNIDKQRAVRDISTNVLQFKVPFTFPWNRHRLFEVRFIFCQEGIKLPQIDDFLNQYNKQDQGAWKFAGLEHLLTFRKEIHGNDSKRQASIGQISFSDSDGIIALRDRMWFERDGYTFCPYLYFEYSANISGYCSFLTEWVSKSPATDNTFLPARPSFVSNQSYNRELHRLYIMIVKERTSKTLFQWKNRHRSITALLSRRQEMAIR